MRVAPFQRTFDLPMHLILLLATLLALLSGPLLYAATLERPRLQRAIDGFVLISVSVLVLVEALPEAYVRGGAWSFAFVALGLLGPTVVEHALSRARREAHLATLGFALLGLIVHSYGDGTALAPASSSSLGLGAAVALHSVPVGLLVWWLMAPVFGRTAPLLTLLAMCASTVTGYLTGPALSQSLQPQGWAWFQALVAGSILHVVFGRPHSRH